MNDAFFWSSFGLVWIFGWVFVFYLFRRAEQNR